MDLTTPAAETLRNWAHARGQVRAVTFSVDGSATLSRWCGNGQESVTFQSVAAAVAALPGDGLCWRPVKVVDRFHDLASVRGKRGAAKRHGQRVDFP